MTDRAPPLHLVAARAGNRLIALDAATVARVLPLPSVSVPPSLPAPIRGLVRFGGAAVALIDPSALLDGTEPAVPALYAHLLVLHEAVAGAPAALLVDRVTGLVATPHVTPLPAEASANGCILGTVALGGETHSLLAVDRVLIAAERERVAALCANLARREQAAAE